MTTKTYPAILVIITSLLFTGPAHAQLRSNAQNVCHVDTKGGGGGVWTYYFCGARGAQCTKKKTKNHDVAVWLYHGESFYFNGNDDYSKKGTYWYCNGTTEKIGKFVKAPNRAKTTVTKTKDLGNNETCNQQIIENVCGETEVIDCFAKDNYKSGTIERNGECISPCPGKQVFDNASSNKCVDCPTTAYQGIGNPLPGVTKSAYGATKIPSFSTKPQKPAFQNQK